MMVKQYKHAKKQNFGIVDINLLRLKTFNNLDSLCLNVL